MASPAPTVLLTATGSAARAPPVRGSGTARRLRPARPPPNPAGVAANNSPARRRSARLERVERPTDQFRQLVPVRFDDLRAGRQCRFQWRAAGVQHHRSTGRLRLPGDGGVGVRWHSRRQAAGQHDPVRVPPVGRGVPVPGPANPQRRPGKLRSRHVEIGGVAADRIDQLGVDPGQAVQIAAMVGDLFALEQLLEQRGVIAAQSAR
jgi:hypothetical protein